MPSLIPVAGTPWVAYVKTAMNQPENHLRASDGPGERPALRVDPRGYDGPIRILVPMSLMSVRTGSGETGVTVSLGIHGGGGSASDLVEWIALVEGPDARRVRFQRQLITRPRFDAAHNTITFPVHSPRGNGESELFLALQFAPAPGPTSEPLLITLEATGDALAVGEARTILAVGDGWEAEFSNAQDVAGATIVAHGHNGLTTLHADVSECREPVLLRRTAREIGEIAREAPDMRFLPLELPLAARFSPKDKAGALEWVRLTTGGSAVSRPLTQFAQTDRASEAVPSAPLWQAKVAPKAIATPPSIAIRLSRETRRSELLLGRIALSEAPISRAAKSAASAVELPPKVPKDDGEQDVEALLKRARAAIVRGDLALAVKTCKRVNTLRADKTAAAVSAAQLAASLDRTEDAATLYERAAKKDPKNFKSVVELGKIRMKQRRPELALAAFERAVELKPNDHGAWHGLGAAQRRLGDLPAATAALSRAIEAGPDKLNSHLEIAGVKESAGDLAGAAQSYETALALAPDDPRAGLRLSRVRHAIAVEAGDREGAIGVLDEGLTRFPSDEGLVRLRAEEHLREGEVDAAFALFDRLATGDGESAAYYTGREARRMGLVDEACRLLETAVEANPQHVPSLTELGRAMAGQRRLESALALFERALSLEGDNQDALRGAGAMHRRLENLDRAEEVLARAVELRPNDVNSHLELGMVYESRGDLASARAAYETATLRGTGRAGPHISLARVLYGLGSPEDAVAQCEKALAISPNDPKAQMYRVWMRQSMGVEKRDVKPDVCILRPLSSQDLTVIDAWGARVERVLVGALEPGLDPARVPAKVEIVGADPFALFAAVSAELTLTVPSGMPDPSQLRMLLETLSRRVGAVSDGPPEKAPALWRSDLLALAGPDATGRSWADIARELRAFVQLRRTDKVEQPIVPLAPSDFEGRDAWLLSTSGVKLFGGVEHFLRSIVPVYRALGLRPVIVGILDDPSEVEPEGEIDGIAFINTSRTIDAIRRLAAHHRPAVAHATTGCGYEIAAALDGLAIRIVYGSHFWRDMFMGDGYFADIDRNPRPRPEFRALCGSVDAPYVNSVYTGEMVTQHFNAAQPIIYSLPFDRDAPDPNREPGGYVLLMSARPEKGFSLLLEVALRLPHVRFKAVASQVNPQRVLDQVAEAGAHNVEIVDWTSDTGALYRDALAVMVPSYAFVETFSRVVIEAQRHGTPVVGSDRGNVPVLLSQSGVSLPEEPDAWAAEIGRLHEDRAYWRRRAVAARENAERYRHEMQFERLTPMVRGAMRRVAVGVGSGIGNILQATPAIRRLSEHLGAAVDILLRADFPGCHVLLEGAPWVGTILMDTEDASSTRFDSVILFDCYGDLIPPFNAEDVFITRRRFPFAMTKDIHEAEFNLLGMKEMAGVPYEPGDAAKYFVGNVERRNVVANRIGVHGGSKGGVWSAKQWPYFPELCRALTERGFEVVSFGTKGEAVEGTVDGTGVSLKETIEGIATCAYFVANDSGLMHVADALDVPLTSIFAPSSIVKNGPLRPASRVIGVNKACSPCQFEMKQLARCTCIREIALERVLGEVLRQMPPLAA